MTRRIIAAIFTTIFYGSNGVWAASVEKDKAMTVAQNWLQYCVSTYGPWGGSNSPTISGEESVVYQGEVVGFNFLVFPQGNILVSARDDLPPIKLYSDTSTLSVTNDDMKEQTAWIANEIFQVGKAVDSHHNEMATAAMNTVQNPDAAAWAILSSDKLLDKAYGGEMAGTQTVSYGPLLTTT